MDRQQLIETLKANIESARQRNLDWLPVPLATAEAILQTFFMFYWTTETETAVVSHKRGVSMAANVQDGKPDARLLIWRQLENKAELPEALKEVLDDLEMAVDAVVEKVIEVADA